MRYNFARHFREPAEIAVSSLHEDAAVFGGRKNINAGIKNLALRFKPDLIGAITTCSSEIIGDDVFGFVDTTKKELKSMEKGVSPTILAGGDLYDMHREIKEAGADIIIGNAYGASMAKEENIPLFRVGFPVFDRLGAQRIHDRWNYKT